MSGISFFKDLIAERKNTIKRKKAENQELAKREQKQKELANQQSWEAFYLKLNLRAQKDKISSFLKKSGGLFNLNEEQQVFYNQLLTEKSNIYHNYNNSNDLYYSHKINATALHNRQMSNYSNIISSTHDIGKYLNQQVMLENYPENIA